MDKYIIENEKSLLKGELKGYPVPGAEHKFDHNGKPLPFPGCSIISKIPLNSDLFYEIKLLQLKFKDLSPEKAYTYLPELFGGYSIILEGNTIKDEKIIRNCRNKLSDLLGIRFENHDTYTFHITLAYILRKLKGDEIKKLIKTNSRLQDIFIKNFPIIQIEKPVLCTFENMYEFKST